MKTCILILGATVFIITGCGVKYSGNVKKMEMNDIFKKSQQDMDELTKPLYRGGQPGKITIKGVIIKKEGEKMLLDERIKVEQVGGKGNRGVSQTLVSSTNRTILSETSDVKILSSTTESKKYINLGCDNLTVEELEGLEPESDKASTDSVLSLSAKKIFICGKPHLSQAFVSLSAEQLILKNASINVKAESGHLSVSVAKMALVGANSIGTSGIDDVIAVLDAPSIDLTIFSEMDGDGSLKVTSIGGNCVQKDEKK